MITIITSPAIGGHAGYNDIKFGVKSDRNSRKTFDIVSVVNNGGKAQFNTFINTQTDPPIIIGDIMLGSGFATSIYNAKFVVTNVTNSLVMTDIDFAGADSGTVTRRNDNFKIKASIFRKNSVYTACTRSDVGGFIAITSNVITEDSVSVGDYLFEDRGLIISPRWVTHRVASVSGNTAVTASVYDNPNTQIIALTEGSGIMYAQPEEVAADSEVMFNVKNLINVNFGLTKYPFGATNIQSAVTQSELEQYAILFEELYEDKNGLFTIPNSGSVISSISTAVNVVNQKNEVQSLARYLTRVNGLFLTDMPNGATIHITEEKQISFIVATVGTQLVYRRTLLNGTVEAWGELTITNYANAGYNTARATAIINTNILNANTKSIEFYIKDVLGDKVTETKTLTVDHRCYDSAVTLYFKNRRGGLDSYHYKVTNSEDLELDREYAKNDDVKFTAFVEGQSIMTLESKYEPKKTYVWLEQLYESREVYMKVGTALERVNIVSRSHTISSTDLFTSILEIEIQEPLRN